MLCDFSLTRLDILGLAVSLSRFDGLASFFNLLEDSLVWQ